jgi:hypothetical protein
MGAHHYTVENKMYSKDILRAKILSTCLPVVLVEGALINPIKGLQNRLSFLE